jgi:hypothetical protein
MGLFAEMWICGERRGGIDKGLAEGHGRRVRG